MTSNWELRRGSTLLGRLCECRPDPEGGPVLYCRFEATPFFEEARPAYERLLRALAGEDYETLGETIQALHRLQLRLHSVETDYIWEGFWLLIRGSEARVEL